MANVESSSLTPEIQHKLEQMQKLLETELSNLNSRLEGITQTGSEKVSELLGSIQTEISSTTTSLNQELETAINSNQNLTDQELRNLQESIDGQLSSLQSFADQLVHDEEGRLVGTLEESLEKFNSVNNTQSAKFSDMIDRISKTVETTTSSPVSLVEARNENLKSDLTQALELEREKLTKSMMELQTEFRDKISSQIEKVFMGVTVTKETLNGIIRDTLSRLEVNLSRLHSGIDDNFTKEIGSTQDMIHDYEGKMLEAIDNSKLDYEAAMQGVLDRNSKTLEKSLNALKQELDTTRGQLQTQLDNLSKEQKDLITSSLNDLDTQINKSKAEVIDSHGLLKDDLGKLMNKNSESITEFMNLMKSNNSKTVTDLLNQIKDKTSRLSNSSVGKVKSGQKEVESLLEQIKKDNKEQVESAIKEMGADFNSIKTEGS